MNQFLIYIQYSNHLHDPTYLTNLFLSTLEFSACLGLSQTQLNIFTYCVGNIWRTTWVKLAVCLLGSCRVLVFHPHLYHAHIIHNARKTFFFCGDTCGVSQQVFLPWDFEVTQITRVNFDVHSPDVALQDFRCFVK